MKKRWLLPFVMSTQVIFGVSFFTWNDGDGNWSVGSNWAGSTAPGGGVQSLITFSATTPSVTTNNDIAVGDFFVQELDVLTDCAINGNAFQMNQFGDSSFYGPTGANPGITTTIANDFQIIDDPTNPGFTGSFGFNIQGANGPTTVNLNGVISSPDRPLNGGSPAMSFQSTASAGVDGIINLNGVNTYTVINGNFTRIYATAGTTLTIRAGVNDAFPDSPFSLETTGSILDANGKTVSIKGIQSGAVGEVKLGSGTLTINQMSAGDTSGTISGSGGSIVVQGTDQLTLSGNNTFTGSTTIGGSATLLLSSASSLSSSTGVANNSSAGTGFDISGITGSSTTIQDLSGTGTINLGSKTLIVGTSNSTTTSGVISGSGGITKVGSGTLTIHGGNYTGSTTISAGTLVITNPVTSTSSSINNSSTLDLEFASSGAFSPSISGGTVALNTDSGSTGTVSFTGTNTYGTVSIQHGALQVSATAAGIPSTASLDVGAAATFNLNSHNQTVAGFNGSGTITLGSNTLTTDLSGSATFSGTITGTGGITKSGSGSQALTGSVQYTGTTTINGGSLTGVPANSAVSVGSGATISYDSTVTAGTITGAGNLSVTSGDPTFPSVNIGGDVTVSGGAPTFDSLTAGGSVSVTGGTPLFNSLDLTGGGSTFSVSGATVTVPPAATIPGGTTLGPSGVFLAGQAGSAGAGTLSFAGGTLEPQNAAATIVFTQPMSIAPAGGTLNTNSGTVTLPSVAASGGGGPMAFMGGGVAVLPAVSVGFTGVSVTGDTTTLIGDNNSLGSTSAVNVDLNGGTLTPSVDNLTIPNTISAGPGGATVDTAGQTMTIAGGITSSPSSGGGVLTVKGGGTMNLTSAATGATDLPTSIGIVGSKVGTHFSFSFPQVPVSITSLVQPGILELTASQTVASLTADTPSQLTLGAGSVLTMNGSSNFAGSASGAGSMAIQAGTLQLTGTNNHSGGITAADGSVVSAASGSSVGSGTLTLNGATFLASAGSAAPPAATVALAVPIAISSVSVMNANSGVITSSGGITGSGTLQTTGGTVDVSGVNSPAAIAVAGGIFVARGDFVTPAVSIAAPGTLKGNGTINGDVVSNGNVQPGTSIGVLTIAGSHTFASGTLTIEFDATTSSSLVTTGPNGTITIDPGVTLTLYNPTAATPSGNPLTILSASTQVVGTFSSIINPYPLISPSLDYSNPQLVVLTLIGMPFVSISGGLSPNAEAVASCLDTLTPAPGSDFDAIVSALRSATNRSELNSNLLQMQPAQYKDLSLAQEDNAVTISSATTFRMQEIYQNECIRGEKRKKNGAWFNAVGQYSEQRNQQQSIGYFAQTGGAVLGYDREVMKNIYVGVGGAYTYSHLGWNEHAGHANLQSGYGTVYGMWYSDYMFTSLSVLGAYNHYQTTRNINFTAGDMVVNRHARSSFSGAEFESRLAVGGLFKLGPLDISPFASADFYFLHQNSFTERNAASLNLSVNATNYRLLRSEGGLTLSHCLATAASKIIPMVQVSVVRENRFGGKHYQSSFAEECCCSFQVFGLQPTRTLVVPVAGLSTWWLDDTLTCSLNYIGEFGEKYQNQRGNLQVDYAF